MHPLEKSTLETVRQEGLLQDAEKTVVGVSAGPDSMALLHVLSRLTHVLDITLAAVYVNHGLRPEEAEVEKNLVAAETDRLGVDFFHGAVDVMGLAGRRKISVEHAARLLRYEFLEKIARKIGARKIALAHTADDQAEELLLRLIRGTARKGLSGMKSLRAARYIRPFLHIPKSRLLAYLEKYSIPFHIDSSNKLNIYLRNRIRNELLPYLAEHYNPGIKQTLIRTANILQDEEEILAQLAEAAFSETVSVSAGEGRPARNNNNGEAGSDDPYPQALQLNLELFFTRPRAIQRRILEKCCWLMASEPRSRQIEQLLHLAVPGSPGRSLHLADGLRVSKKAGLLIFAYPHGRKPFRGNLEAEAGARLPETIITTPGSYDFPTLNKRLLVTCIDDAIPPAGEILPAGEYLDSDLFSFPLILRSPRPGDRFHPLGAPGTRKVHDFLCDQKIERHLRSGIPVLCSADSIVALPGLRIDHRYRITAKTINAIKVIWEEMV